MSDTENKILVVDDEKTIREMFHEAFEMAGYEVRAAADAEEALEILDKEVIPVMFLDLVMPGMNGVELCRRIRQRNSISVIYAITGNPSYFELSDCREAGFDDYFLKPLKFEFLFDMTKAALEKIDRWMA